MQTVTPYLQFKNTGYHIHQNLIRAIDIESGETLWSAPLPARGQANPLVYEANGREHLMIVATGHHFMETPSGDYVLTWALPE